MNPYDPDPLTVQPDVPEDRFTDAEKLLLLAAWFDMWDRPETDRQAILDDPRNPGRNEVQRDLRRIAGLLAGPPTVVVVPEDPPRSNLLILGVILAVVATGFIIALLWWGLR